ncbi:MAG TPA: hypothetical protein VM936_13045 [Pyrinomonadaceae bacterium]|jgi:hypothetical protein|nr:hypothetical protein [Pyrinomonadaceae bacterium]
MFGLGKIFGDGLFGKFFDSIGMGWMGNVLSLAVDVMSGNWLAAAKDVFDLVSKFSNSWSNQVSPFQPLGDFAFGGGGCFGDLTSGRVDNIMNDAGGSQTIRNGMTAVLDAVIGRNEILFNQTAANRGVRV